MYFINDSDMTRIIGRLALDERVFRGVYIEYTVVDCILTRESMQNTSNIE